MVRLQLSALRRRVGREDGVSIVTALMVSTTVFAMGTVWTVTGIHQVESSSFERMREQALHAAEAGVNHAISVLAADLHYPGTSAPVTLPDGTGQYEVTVSPVDPSDPDDLDRYIVAKGYAPSKTSDRRAARQLEQQVLLDPTDGFDFALFASPGGIIGNNNGTITGDVYSRDSLTVAQFTKVYGGIVTRGGLTTGNQVRVSGNIQVLGNVSLENTQTVVQGSIFAGGDVAGTGSVDGHVQAGGAVTLDPAKVGGTIAASSPPPEPPALALPTFTWDASNYPSATTWTSAAAFQAYWEANINTMAGAHRIEGGDGVGNQLTLDKRWTMVGDVTIASDGPIKLNRDVANGTSGDVQLTVVSFSAQSPAIELTNNLTMPSSVKIVLFAPNGSIDFSQLKDFQGVVYAKSVKLSQQFTLAHAPVQAPGFNWDATSATHFIVKLRTFREVAFSP